MIIKMFVQYFLLFSQNLLIILLFYLKFLNYNLYSELLL